jgi:hypothetical protein
LSVTWASAAPSEITNVPATAKIAHRIPMNPSKFSVAAKMVRLVVWLAKTRAILVMAVAPPADLDAYQTISANSAFDSQNVISISRNISTDRDNAARASSCRPTFR